MTPLEYISFIHEILPIIKFGFEIQCYAFHKLLKTQFPEALPYYNSNHVISLIGDKYYDLEGLVDPAKSELIYLPMEEHFGKNWINIHESENLLLSFYKESIINTLNNYDKRNNTTS